MFITTKMVVGKLGYQHLAAVGIAGDLSFEILVILMGLLSIIGVLAAQAKGAGNKSEVGQSVRQGILVASMIGIPAMVLIWNLDLVLHATGQDPVVIELATPYLRGLSGFVLPVLWFAVFRNFVAALAQPLAVMVITVAAVFLNYLLTIWFVYGGFGGYRNGFVRCWTGNHTGFLAHVYFSDALHFSQAGFARLRDFQIKMAL